MSGSHCANEALKLDRSPLQVISSRPSRKRAAKEKRKDRWAERFAGSEKQIDAKSEILSSK